MRFVTKKSLHEITYERLYSEVTKKNNTKVCVFLQTNNLIISFKFLNNQSNMYIQIVTNS